jgi:hypothetical protein
MERKGETGSESSEDSDGVHGRSSDEVCGRRSGSHQLPHHMETEEQPSLSTMEVTDGITELEARLAEVSQKVRKQF